MKLPLGVQPRWRRHLDRPVATSCRPSDSDTVAERSLVHGEDLLIR
jgi:hypothetical protein